MTLLNLETITNELMRQRAEWIAKKREPYFAERSEWVNGVVKGLDLAIWVVSQHRN